MTTKKGIESRLLISQTHSLVTNMFMHLVERHQSTVRKTLLQCPH